MIHVIAAERDHYRGAYLMAARERDELRTALREIIEGADALCADEANQWELLCEPVEKWRKLLEVKP